MTALSGFARSTAESASDFATLVYNLVLDIRDSYRPGVHCMRGPGPKWRAKSIRRVVVATPLTVQAEKRQDKTRASREMTSSNQFNAFAAARGEGLHPKLLDLLQRAAASGFRRSRFGMMARFRPDGHGGIARQRNVVSAWKTFCRYRARTGNTDTSKVGSVRPLRVLGSRQNTNVSTIGDMMMKKPLLCMTAAVSLVALTSAAQAHSTYDGPWNLLFVTQRGACDPTYNFSVNITDGIVTHPNLVKFRGYVARSGATRASVTVHDKYASGSGRLSRMSGHGIWGGRSGNSRCTGYWTAQRN